MGELVKKETGYLETLSLERELINHETNWLVNFTSKQTRRTYSVAFREFCQLHGIKTPQGFRSVITSDIISYRDFLINTKKASNRSVRNRLASLSSCFNYLRSKNVVESNPTEGVERPKVDETSGETPAMTNEQVRLFLSQPDTQTLKGARDSAILYFLFFTGSRIGAPSTIKVKNFYQDKGFYVLKWRKKGGKNQIVPVHPELQTALLHYLELSGHGKDPEAPLFSAVKKGRNKGEGLSNQWFSEIWRKYRKKAGLPEQFTPHSSRATFATTADENGVNIQDIQQALGHANIATTQPYIHSRKQYKDSAIFSIRY